MYDKTTFLSGLAMGLCGKGNPTFEGSGKMLYNGVELPALPEWDKTVYPYAYITDSDGNSGNLYKVYIGKTLSYWTDDTGTYWFSLSEAMVATFDNSGAKTAWSDFSEYSGVFGSTTYTFLVVSPWHIWANFDMTNSDGSVVLAASEPVPVEDAFTKGYHAGAELRRKRVLPEKEPVAYPTMAASDTWYKGTTARNTITEINLVKSYTVTGNETESWAADVDGTGSIMCYLNGTVLTICSMGAEKIMANEDASYMLGFYPTYKSFTSVTAINGMKMLNTRNVTTMLGMFAGCDAPILDVSNFDTSNVTDMSRMFYNCNGVNSLNLSKFDTSKVTNMSEMFKTTSLAVLDLSGFDTHNVTDMSEMFRQSKDLVAINLSGFDTSNVISMSNMFDDCYALTSLDLSRFNTSKVTSMGSMFSNCKVLTSLNLSGFDTSNVISMSNMFSCCYSLASVDVSNFDTRKVTTMMQMFNHCTALTSLNIHNFDTSSVADMKYMFSTCEVLTVIYVGDGWNTENADTTNMFISCGVSEVTYV